MERLQMKRLKGIAVGRSPQKTVALLFRSPRQEPASFSLSKVMKKLAAPSGAQ